MRRLTLAIEEEKCWGCKTCEVACKQEHQAPSGVKLIRIGEEGPRRVGERWHFVFRATRCLHCDEPACVAACSVSAITKRGDGIVVLNRSECEGCRACIEACPFDAIDFDVDAGVAVKCNLCHHRIDEGLLPACADNVCLAHCIHLIEDTCAGT